MLLSELYKIGYKANKIIRCFQDIVHVHPWIESLKCQPTKDKVKKLFISPGYKEFAINGRINLSRIIEKLKYN